MKNKKKLNIAVGIQFYLPYSQSWIYRQLNRKYVKVILCNELVNPNDFPFAKIVLVPFLSFFVVK